MSFLLNLLVISVSNRNCYSIFLSIKVFTENGNIHTIFYIFDNQLSRKSMLTVRPGLSEILFWTSCEIQRKLSKSSDLKFILFSVNSQRFRKISHKCERTVSRMDTWIMIESMRQFSKRTWRMQPIRMSTQCKCNKYRIVPPLPLLWNSN